MNKKKNKNSKQIAPCDSRLEFRIVILVFVLKSIVCLVFSYFRQTHTHTHTYANPKNNNGYNNRGGSKASTARDIGWQL